MHDCCKQECKHTNVKFCSKCLKVYCVDCGREWEDKCMLNHFWPYYEGTTITPQITYTYTAVGNTSCTH